MDHRDPMAEAKQCGNCQARRLQHNDLRMRIESLASAYRRSWTTPRPDGVPPSTLDTDVAQMLRSLLDDGAECTCGPREGCTSCGKTDVDVYRGLNRDVQLPPLPPLDSGPCESGLPLPLTKGEFDTDECGRTTTGGFVCGNCDGGGCGLCIG